MKNSTQILLFFLVIIGIIGFGMYTMAVEPRVFQVPQGGTGISSTSANTLLATGTSTTAAFVATTSPTVGYLVATSTTATSTFANGINLTGGCFRIGGACLSTGITSLNGLTGATQTFSVTNSSNDWNTLTISSSGTAHTFITAASTSPAFGFLVATSTTIQSQFLGGVTVTCTDCITNANTIDALTVSGGTINNSAIGATTRSTGAFTTFNTTGLYNAFGNITATSTIDFSAAVFRLVASSSLTTLTSGEFGIDTTTGQLRGYDGAATRVYGNGRIYASFTYATSTAWTGTTTIPLGTAYIAETWNGVQCFTDVGTLNVSLNDGTNRMNMFNASTTVGTVVLSSNNTFTAAEKRYADIGTPATAPTKVSCTISKSLDTD